MKTYKIWVQNGIPVTVSGDDIVLNPTGLCTVKLSGHVVAYFIDATGYVVELVATDKIKIGWREKFMNFFDTAE